MRIAIVASIVIVLGGVSRVGAQAPVQGASIAGVVLDGAGHPVPDADVLAFPDKARGRTDSAGKFTIAKLDGGFYHVRVRRIGYRPAEITTDVAKNGHVDLKFELAIRPAMLDTVIVEADGKCAAVSYSGFNCRKHFGKGVYMTDDDIAGKGAVELGDLFTDVPGFVVENRPTTFGLKPIPFAAHGGCLNALVNGRPIAVTNQLPLAATDLLAVEIYATPSSVPSEYQRYIWDARARQTSPRVGRDHGDQPCALAVYWTSMS
jgi:hypothetical protein